MESLEEIALYRYQTSVLDYLTNFGNDAVTEINLLTSIEDCEIAYDLAKDQG